ncbi:hypothetical protein [Luteibacter sp.]|uniref:hypothetical protein n=1 Tax=Luteibacter sp. TaxID=1886636 RepID=UPI002809116F|nr:hypothetical protein [Luteibacter sp.]MDQ8050724.1 hypothetical protein [Luteibacter sp.]
MNKLQADQVFKAIWQRPEVRGLYDFWRLGQPAGADGWPDFLRAVADGLDALSSVAPTATGDRI